VDISYQDRDDGYEQGQPMHHDQDTGRVEDSDSQSFTSFSLFNTHQLAGYPFPHSESQPQAYLTPPPPAPTTDQHRVHYPPSPYMAQQQTYTNVPLNDHATSREHLSPNPNPYEANFNPPRSGANTPSGSGNSKKRWSFLPSPMGSANTFENRGMNEKAQSGASTPKRPKGPHRPGSWDLLGDRAEWEEYNPAQASVDNLKFAEGDVGTNKVSTVVATVGMLLTAVDQSTLLLGSQQEYRVPMGTLHHPRYSASVDPWNRRTDRVPRSSHLGNPPSECHPPFAIVRPLIFRCGGLSGSLFFGVGSGPRPQSL
jgi:hypothetical protein